MIKRVPLPFSQSDVVPQMSAETMAYHYGKHYLGYLKKVNAAVAETELAKLSLEEVIRSASKSSDQGLLNNAAQVWNHAFFWRSIAPRADIKPDAIFRQAVERQFGEWDAFAKDFVSAGAAHFGSGWLWLAWRPKHGLSIETTHDAQPVWLKTDLVPLLVCDLWEHAYYIDWRNDRAGFLKSFVKERANWRFSGRQLSALVHQRPGWCYPR